jgi:UDP-N-acetylmuramoyl-tripeptide--D-alanyl-D-alanine ligase
MSQCDGSGFLFAKKRLIGYALLVMRQMLAKLFLYYIKFWAKIALFFTKAKIIGVAGSLGKTSTKVTLKIALSPFGKVLVTEGNSETGVPLGILGVKQERYDYLSWLLTALHCPFKVLRLIDCDYLVVEMGTDDFVWPKNMDFLLSVVKPEYVIWLNTAPAHLEQFAAKATTSDYEQVLHDGRKTLAQTDGRIITHNDYKVAIINGDDEYIRQVACEVADQNKLCFYGESQNNKIYLLEHKNNFPNTEFKIFINGEVIEIKLLGQLLTKEYWQVFASALQLIAAMNLDVGVAVKAIEANWQIPNGRGRLLKAVNDSWLLDGSYNASPDAFTSQLNLLKVVAVANDLKPVVVVGDMRELGEITATAHKILAQEIALVTSNVFAVGSSCCDYLLPELANLGIQARWFKNSLELALAIHNSLETKSLVLIKGSQNTIFLETVVESLLADKSDIKYLCRQSKYWQEVRQQFFTESKK